MQQVPVFVSFFLDASRPRKDGSCLIKMNIYQKPNKKPYRTIFYATKAEWEKLHAPKLRDEKLKELEKELAALKESADKIIKTITPFSFIAFEEIFFQRSKSTAEGSQDVQQTPTNNLLVVWFQNAISIFTANEQVGNASIYKTTMNSINGFRKNLMLHDITYQFLLSYEQTLKSENKTFTTISIYMRTLRAIINDAIDAKVLSKDNYPFEKYEIPSGTNVKKALKNDDIKRLLSYKPCDPDQQKALDFWVFSYLCNGMNFADIIALKPSNISGQFLSFYRQKTIRTKKKDLRPIKVGLNQRALEIIEKWKNKDRSNPYLFSVLEPNLSAKTIKNRCQRFIKWVNETMYEVRDDLEIDCKTSTYAARHTFSTVLKRKGVPISYIKDALGHSSVATTENYLDSFEDEATLVYANELTSFPDQDVKQNLTSDN